MGKKVASSRYRRETFEIVLGGGGIKGFGHLGFLKAVEESGIKVSGYTGVSVGSLVAAFYANGYSVDEIKEIFAREVFKISSENLLRGLIPYPGTGLSLKGFADDWVKRYQLEPRKSLKIVAYNLFKRSPILFEGVDYDLSIALSASCAVPFVMQPVWLSPFSLSAKIFGEGDSGALLVDGGLHHPCPSDFCKDRAIVSKLGFVDRAPKEFSGIADAYFHAMEWAGSGLLNWLYPDPEAHLIVDVGLPDVSGLSFGVSEKTHGRMVNHGYRRAKKALSGLEKS